MTDLLTTPDNGPNGQIRRDRWGRYLLPHPETGVEQPWTRVTTLSSTLADRFGLEKWMQRNIVYGIGQRQDLYARAAAARLEDKDTLTQIVDAAQAAAADKAGANLGSAIHQFTERIDRGEPVNVPPPYDRDIAAYQATMEAAGLAVVLGWVERVVCVPELEVVGTLDRVVEGPWANGVPRIADVKTGKDVVRYGMTEIALQLALYAHASYVWNGQRWLPMITVDRNTGIVMHVPVGQGVCIPYEVDIFAGWEAVQLAVDVRAWRKRKDLAQQIPAVQPAVRAAGPVAATTSTPVPAVAAANQRTTGSSPERQTLSGSSGQALSREKGGQPADGSEDRLVAAPESKPLPAPTPALPTAQIQWLKARVQYLLDNGYGGQLAAEWTRHPGVPTFKHGGPQTPDHVQQIIEMCGTIEDNHGLPFGPPDPTMQPTTKAKARAKA